MPEDKSYNTDPGWPAQGAVAQLWPEPKGGATGLRSAVLTGPQGPRPASRPRAPATAVMELRAMWRVTGSGWTVLTSNHALGPRPIV